MQKTVPSNPGSNPPFVPWYRLPEGNVWERANRQLSRVQQNLYWLRYTRDYKTTSEFHRLRAMWLAECVDWRKLIEHLGA